jgi:hypothetical protein
MGSQTDKYLEYARECVRLAGHAEGVAERDKLVELARVWMEAAVTEEEAATGACASRGRRQLRSVRPTSDRPA